MACMRLSLCLIYDFAAKLLSMDFEEIMGYWRQLPNEVRVVKEERQEKT